MCTNLLKMPRKKSQINMLETIVVLAVFFILVVFVFIFYLKVSETNVEIEKEENAQSNAIKIAQKASFLPELQCSQEHGVIDNCIDLLKLNAASEIIQENEVYYYDRLLFSRITINEIYPGTNDWMLYDRPLEDFSNKIVTNIPISLFDPIDDKNSFGVMTVELFLK